MDEYISRKAIKDAVRHRKTKVPITADDNEKFVYAVWNGALDNAGFEIDRLPAADVKPVVRGEWDEIERGGLLNRYALFRCTHCGNIFKVYEDTLNAGRGDKNFCPNCGADMRPRENLKAGAEYADADTIISAT